MSHSLIHSHPFFFPDSMEEASALANSVGILAGCMLGKEKKILDVSFVIALLTYYL